jgi:hypothetical protein
MSIPVFNIRNIADPHDMRPLVRLDEYGRLSTAVHAGIEMLHEQCFIFRYNRRLYGLVTYHPFALRRLQPIHLQWMLEQLARWQHFDNRRKCWIGTAPPLELCRTILAMDDWWPFPWLDREPVLWVGGLAS